jgi:hypothetical protein
VAFGAVAWRLFRPLVRAPYGSTIPERNDR